MEPTECMHYESIIASMSSSDGSGGVYLFSENIASCAELVFFSLLDW